MSRRIQTAPRPDAAPLLLGREEEKRPIQGDGYLDRLVKYIPSEIIALYLGATNVVPHSGKSDETIALWVIALLAAACTPIYMYYATRDPDQPTLWSQIVISSIAFPVWVFAIGGPFQVTWPNWYPEHRWIAAIVISFATFLLGIYEPNDSPPDHQKRRKEESAAGFISAD